MKIDISVSSPVVQTPRALQMMGMFDLPPSERSDLRWQGNLPIEEKDWSIGLIVGPSGSGKSTVARKLFGDYLIDGFEWPRESCVLDGFPESMGIKEIVELLSSVGFSSPPAWLRPFSVLSVGEQFRVTMARVLAEAGEIAVVDEFTSVVDRQVARIGSAALAKTIRRRKQKFIAVTCHEDVAAWLCPDWIYRPELNQFQWVFLQRPRIELKINRVHHSAWRIFHKHHYLSAKLSTGAVCFCAFVDDRPVAFCAYLPFFGRKVGWPIRRVTRVVCLPDYQGIGIGTRLVNVTASAWKAFKTRVTIATAHPGQIGAYARHPDWAMLRAPALQAREGGTDRARRANERDLKRTAQTIAKSRAIARLTASFGYIGPTMDFAQAQQCLGSWAKIGGN